MNGLKYIREKFGLSGAALAKKLTVSQPTVFEWEHGKRKIPVDQQEKLSKMFNVPSEYFGEILESQIDEIDRCLEMSRSDDEIDHEFEENEQALKQLKISLQRIGKILKSKANKFDVFSDYTDHLIRCSKICNQFADVLEVYGADQMLQRFLTAMIFAKGDESDKDSNLTKALRQELLRKEEAKEEYEEMKKLTDNENLY